MAMHVVKTIERGGHTYTLEQIDPFTIRGGASIRVLEDGTSIGEFIVLGGPGTWTSTHDSRSPNRERLVSFGSSFAAELNRGEVSLGAGGLFVASVETK